ncbi:MAG: hypothetical protein RLZ81_957 [Pseudomonadota bacterium]
MALAVLMRLTVESGEKSAMAQESCVKWMRRMASMTLCQPFQWQAGYAASSESQRDRRAGTRRPGYFSWTEPETATVMAVLPASTGIGASAATARASSAITRGRGGGP